MVPQSDCTDRASRGVGGVTPTRKRQTQQARAQLATLAIGKGPISLQDALRTSLSGKRRHAVRIVVNLDDAASEASARKRVHDWLETFGHTSVSHGFEFLETED